MVGAAAGQMDGCGSVEEILLWRERDSAGSRFLFFAKTFLNDVLYIQETTPMPKIKTNRSAAKRFKRTGTGKFVFSKSYGSHILTSKTTKRKRSLRKSQIADKTNDRELKLLLPNG